jgi:hypothetical protein
MQETAINTINATLHQIQDCQCDVVIWSDAVTQTLRATLQLLTDVFSSVSFVHWSSCPIVQAMPLELMASVFSFKA